MDNFDLIALLGVFPALFGILTVILAFGAYKKAKSGAQAKGVIVDLWKDHRADKYSAYRYTPIIEYAVNGKQYRFRSNYASTSMRVGQEVTLLYDKENPSKAWIKSGMYIAPMVLGILTITFSIAYIILMAVMNGGV